MVAMGRRGRIGAIYYLIYAEIHHAQLGKPHVPSKRTSVRWQLSSDLERLPAGDCHTPTSR